MALAFIVLAVVLLLAVKGLRDPLWAVFAFAVAYELQPGELYPPLAVLHIERVLIVYLLIIFYTQKIHFRYPPITKKFLWFYGAILIATPTAFWVSNSAQFCVTFLEVVIYHLFLVAILDSEDRIRKYLLLYTGLVTWIGLSSLYEYHMGVLIVRMHIERAIGMTSAGGDPDTMASTMIVSMPLTALLMSKGTSKRTKIFGLAAFAIYLTTIIDTGSRTAFLAFLFLLVIASLYRRRNWKFLPVVVLSLPLLWLVIPQQYKTRYETVETRDQDESYTDRLLSWQGGVKMFLHNPITGIGPDNYTDANGVKYWPDEPKHYLNAHSLYFKLLGELGIVGIITFFAFAIAVMRTNWYLARRSGKDLMDPIVRRYPQACNLCYCVLLFTGYSAHNTYRTTWYTLGAVTAALSVLKPAAVTSQGTKVAETKRVPAWVPAKKPIDVESITV